MVTAEKRHEIKAKLAEYKNFLGCLFDSGNNYDILIGFVHYYPEFNNSDSAKYIMMCLKYSRCEIDCLVEEKYGIKN